MASDDRAFVIGVDQPLLVEATSPYRGVLRSVIKRMKYDGEVRWAPLFGRLLVRYLEQSYGHEAVNLIVPNPTHATRPIRHTELIVAACADLATHKRWRFDDPARPSLIKRVPTPTSHGASYDGRSEAAAALYESLAVVRPEVVEGQHIVVIDDVAATGQQLHSVQRRLLEHGAASVVGLVVARPDLPVLSPAAAMQARLALMASRSKLGPVSL